MCEAPQAKRRESSLGTPVGGSFPDVVGGGAGESLVDTNSSLPPDRQSDSESR